MKMKKPWWDKRYGKNAICTITKCRLRPGTSIIFLECNHGFYRKAIKEWIKTKKECPNCRSSISTEMISMIQRPSPF